MAITKQEALEKYRDAMRGKVKGSEAVAIVRRFLVTRASWDRQGVTTYLRGLEEDGMAPSSVDLVMRTLRAFGNHVGLVWPGTDWSWDRKAAPSRQVEASPQFVARLVSVMPRVDRRAAAWLALSILYGCRAGELAMWSAKDLGQGAIFIHREKDGDSRWYWLPPQAERWLKGVLIAPARRGEVYKAWGRLLDASGLAAVVPDGVAWHALRYAVVRGLRRAGVPDGDTYRFLSWAGDAEESKDMKMLHHYDNPNAVLDVGGVRPAAPVVPKSSDLRASDGKAWEAHPFLPLLG